MRFPVPTLFALAFALVLSAPASGTQASDSPDVVVAVDCFSDPETVRVEVTDDLEDPEVTFVGISSVVDPRSDEPFLIRDTFPPGFSATYYSGPSAPAGSPGTLSRRSIFDDEAQGEGVAVSIRPYGSSLPESELPVLKVGCDEGSKGFEVDAPPACPIQAPGARWGLAYQADPLPRRCPYS